MVPLRRFTVDEYHRLIALGFFGLDERCELLEGLIINKMPRDLVHDAAVEMADEVLRSRLPEGWRVRIQSAITTSESEPEPDLVVVRGGPESRLERHPDPNDLALLVEVANTSVAGNRLLKGRAYARAGISFYWIINLIDRRVEVYSDPSGPDSAPAYRRRDDYADGQSIPLIIGGIVVEAVPVAELLPRSAARP